MDDEIRTDILADRPETPALKAIFRDVGNAIIKRDVEALHQALDAWHNDKTKLWRPRPQVRPRDPKRRAFDKDRYLNRLVHTVIRYNEVRIFECFLDHGMTKFDWWESIFRSPRPADLLPVLLKHGVSINQMDNTMTRPYWWKVFELDDEPTLKFLLKQEPDLTYRDRHWKLTALDAAVLTFSVKSFRLLMAAGADPKHANPLHTVASLRLTNEDSNADTEDRAIPSMEFLLDEINIDINKISDHGRTVGGHWYVDGTALQEAVLSKTPARILFLLQRGADPSIKNVEGDDVLEYAKRFEHSRQEELEVIQTWLAQLEPGTG